MYPGNEARITLRECKTLRSCAGFVSFTFINLQFFR
jgi:hypothetical protein